jgi:cytoskeletal protein RodZ
MNELKNDNNLREAVNRREQQLPPMPADLNKRLMQRITESEPARPETKSRRLWIYAAVAVAASIALLIVFNFGKQQTPQESLVALRVDQPTTSVPEPVEGEPVIEEPSNAASESVEAPAPQPSQKPAKKRQETVMKLVELIPTPEVEPALTAEAEPTLEAAANAEEDPLVAMAAQLEDIRSRGQRLQQEITAIMNN